MIPYSEHEQKLKEAIRNNTIEVTIKATLLGIALGAILVFAIFSTKLVIAVQHIEDARQLYYPGETK